MEPRSNTPVDAAGNSFEALASDGRPMLVGYLSALLGDAHLAEDLAQESLLTADRIF